MTTLINTPNGNIGRALAERLLDAGEPLVVIQRDPSKVKDLATRGARVIEGSIDDATVLDRAFSGVDAVFWLTPPTFRPDYADWALSTARAATAAAKKHDVERVLVLSSIGATEPKAGPISVVGRVEQVFRDALPNVLALRAGYFFENFRNELANIQNDGAFYGPIPADLPVAMVATADIAEVAADSLRRGFTGHQVRGAYGPVDLSFGEVATILARVLEREVRYVNVPLDAASEAMRGAGAPDFVVALYTEMLAAISDGRVVRDARADENTTRTDFASFARDVLRPSLR